MSAKMNPTGAPVTDASFLANLPDNLPAKDNKDEGHKTTIVGHKGGVAKATWSDIGKGSGFFVDENTIWVENGVELPRFPCAGIVEDGKFRKLTEGEIKDEAVHKQLYEEAKAVKMPVSLREHPALGQRVLYFGHHQNRFPITGEYRRGTATVASPSELKEKPFVKAATIDGGMESELAVAISIGSHHSFRILAGEKVWNIESNYGFLITGPDSMNLDGVDLRFVQN
jgi:hypothetical protein